VRRLVEEQRIPIDVGDYDARTPLHLASGEGRQLYIIVPRTMCLTTSVSRCIARAGRRGWHGTVQRACRTAYVNRVAREIPSDLLTCTRAGCLSSPTCCRPASR
jgi:hypothetical protein